MPPPPPPPPKPPAPPPPKPPSASGGVRRTSPPRGPESAECKPLRPRHRLGEHAREGSAGAGAVGRANSHGRPPPPGNDPALQLVSSTRRPPPQAKVRLGSASLADQLKQRRSGMNIDVANLNDFELWDEEYSHSRTDVGFVGLSNQGATCYMNSLIQGLFMTPEFRDALYESTAPAAAEAGAGLEVLLEAEEYQEQLKKGSSNIPRQLQLLFARLQLSKRRAVGTVNLTSSFGWGSDEAFQQQDVSELFTMLIDALEQSLQVQQASLASTGGDATSLASPSALFAGSMNSVLEYWLPDGEHVLRRRAEVFNSIGASATPLPLQHWQYVRPRDCLSCRRDKREDEWAYHGVELPPQWPCECVPSAAESAEGDLLRAHSSALRRGHARVCVRAGLFIDASTGSLETALQRYCSPETIEGFKDDSGVVRAEVALRSICLTDTGYSAHGGRGMGGGTCSVAQLYSCDPDPTLVLTRSSLQSSGGGATCPLVPPPCPLMLTLATPAVHTRTGCDGAARAALRQIAAVPHDQPQSLPVRLEHRAARQGARPRPQEALYLLL